MKVIWNGPVGVSGYGRVSRSLIPELAKLVDLYLIPAYPEEMGMAPDMVPYLQHFNEKQLDADVAVRMTIANPVDGMCFAAKRRIFYTMLECDRIPPFWVSTLNKMDQVWTMSNWGAEVFRQSGVKTQIEVVPGGVDLGIFNPFREPLMPKEDDDKFRFLFVGKWETRKGVDLACRAFTQEFKEKEKVAMMLHCDTIKLYLGPNFNVYKELLRLKLGNNRAELKIFEGILQDFREMGRLYTSGDCFVSPVRGEGWNLPLAEAMACGLPSIATDWSGHTDFANEKNCLLLKKFKLEPVPESQLAYQYLQFGKWAEPDVKEIQEKMRYVFDNQEEAKKIGNRAAKDMEKWTWSEAAKKAQENIEKLLLK